MCTFMFRTMKSFLAFVLLLTACCSPAGAQKADPLKPDYHLHPGEQWETEFSDFQFEIYKEHGHTLPYRLYMPFPIVPGKRYPLVVFMHGYGERGSDNRKQFFRFRTFPFWKKYPCFVLAPQCPESDSSGEATWVKTDFGASSSRMNRLPAWPLALAMDLLDTIIDQDAVDRRRIYLTGLSMGGFATWELLERAPERFAAAMPLSGGGDSSLAFTFSHVPLWVFHGLLDRTVQPERSVDMVNAIKRTGAKPRLTLYPDLGHDTWTRTYSNIEVWDWLFKQHLTR